MTTERLHRRCRGYHDLRLDGMSDLLHRASGASVFDLGCNRGLVGFEFANNGATEVHGCDNYVEGITTAKHLFADLRNCESKHEVVDLSKGVGELMKHFPDRKYDFMIMLAIYHKLERVMSDHDLHTLVAHLARSTTRYLAWRGHHSDRFQSMLKGVGMKLVQWSDLDGNLEHAEIWGWK